MKITLFCFPLKIYECNLFKFFLCYEKIAANFSNGENYLF